MEFIDMRFIMNRLLDNPVMKNIKLSSIAAYVKDFSSINAIGPVVGFGYTYTKILGYKATLPTNYGDVRSMYLCDSNISSALVESNRMSASMRSSKIPNKDKREYGTYDIKGNTIFTDVETGVLEVYHTMMRVDEYGFPVLPYDGSLMEAVTNYIMYKYFKLLWQNDIMPKNKSDDAHQEYVWYIGQYTTNAMMPSYDEAVAWANSWQRLLDDKNLDLDDKSFPEILKL